MRFCNYILCMLQMMSLRVLIRFIKIFSSFFFLSTSNSLYIDLGVFFFFNTHFSFARTGFFNTKLSKSNSWKISREIWRRFWKVDVIIKSLQFLYLVEKILLVVFFEEGIVDENNIRPYQRSSPSCIRLFVTTRNFQYLCFCLFSSILAFLSLFFSSASSLLFSTTSKLKTRVPWLSYWIPIHWAYRFFRILATSNSVLVWFRITLSAIARLAAFKVLWMMVSFGESRVWFLKSDTSSSTSLTSLILAEVRGIWPIKYRVCNSVLEVLLGEKKVLVSWRHTESFWNTTAGL